MTIIKHYYAHNKFKGDEIPELFITLKTKRQTLDLLHNKYMELKNPLACGYDNIEFDLNDGSLSWVSNNQHNHLIIVGEIEEFDERWLMRI